MPIVEILEKSQETEKEGLIMKKATLPHLKNGVI